MNTTFAEDDWPNDRIMRGVFAAFIYTINNGSNPNDCMLAASYCDQLRRIESHDLLYHDNSFTRAVTRAVEMYPEDSDDPYIDTLMDEIKEILADHIPEYTPCYSKHK
jgi:hypothetical protein